MPTNFSDRLRMDQLFSGGNTLTPEISGPNPQFFSQLLGSVLPHIKRKRADERQHEKDMFNMKSMAETNRMNKLTAAETQQKPDPSQMNVVFNPGMTEYQRQRLSLDRENMAADNAAAKDRIGISGQNAETSKMRADVYQMMNDISNSEKIKKTGEQRTEDIAQRGVEQRKTAGVNNQADVELEKARESGRGALAEKNAWTTANIEDPEKPGSFISVRYNPITNKTERIQMGEKPVGPLMNKGKLPDDLDPTRKDALEKANATLADINGLIDEKGILRPEIEPAVGPSRRFKLALNSVGLGTGATDANTKIKNFMSKSVLDLITSLKAKSKTGANPLGTLSNKDLGVLEAAANKLDPAGSEKAFAEELNAIRTELMKVLKEPESDDAAAMIAKIRAEMAKNKPGVAR